MAVLSVGRARFIVSGAKGSGDYRVGHIFSTNFNLAPARNRNMAINDGRPGGALTRAALREAVYGCCSALSRADARKILDATFDEICDALTRGEQVKLRSFGTFNVREKRGRVGRNPKTGIEAPICPRKVLTFKASPVLVARINGDIVPDEAE
jgi:integration host factor subunit alpha